MKALTEKEAFCKAAAYCSRSEHCPSEVREKLRQWGVEDEEMKQRIVCQLMDEGYLDETRFCEAFVHDKFRFNHWGRQKIIFALKQKGIPSEVIEGAVGEMDEEELLSSAVRLLQAKLKQIRTDDPYETYTKLMRFAAGRGIEMDIARKAVKQLLE